MAQTTNRQSDEAPRTRELEILNAVAEALNRAPDVRQALTETLSLVADLLGLETGWVWLVDPASGQFYSAAVQHLPPFLREPVRMTGRSCWCIDAYREGGLTPKNIDMMECSRLHATVQTEESTQGLHYHASIPLYFQEKPLGIMNVAAPSWRRLSTDELRLLSTIGYQVGIAIERSRLAEDAALLARLEERTRLAREIHDTLAQDLTAIILHLESGLAHLEQHPERTRQRLEAALSSARQALEEARRSVTDLRAAVLDGKPLSEALLAFGRAFTAETGIRVHVQASADRVLPTELETQLYRIAQETLSNIRRHAHATEVLIRLRTLGDRIRLSIQDNGAGFNPDSIKEGTHGLLGMRERARLIGGSLRIVSSPGQGVAVAVVVPVEQT